MNRFANLGWALAVCLIGLASMGYLFMPQKNASTWSTATRADTACTASASDAGGITDATADLACLNTGDVDVGGWQQVTVYVKSTRSASTAVVMQCDVSPDAGITWFPVMYTDSTGAKSIRTWTYTTSISHRMSHNFDVNADKLRCRFSMTGGGSGDKISYLVRQGSIVKQ